MARILIGIIAGLLVQGLALGLYIWVEGQREPEELLRYERLSGTKQAPELLLQREEQEIKLSSLRGRFVLVHFWATWCKPCQRELPELLALSRERAFDGRLSLLAISEDRDWGAVHSYFEGDIPPEIVWDAEGKGENLYEVSTLPDTYLIDPEGRLLLRFGGARDWDSEQAKLLLQRTLSKP